MKDKLKWIQSDTIVPVTLGQQKCSSILHIIGLYDSGILDRTYCCSSVMIAESHCQSSGKYSNKMSQVAPYISFVSSLTSSTPS